MGYLQAGAYTVVVEVDEGDAGNIGWHILVEELGGLYAVAAEGSNESVGDCAGCFNAPYLCICRGGDTGHAADFCGVAVAFLHQIVVEAGREEENRLFTGSLYTAAAVGSNLGLTGEYAKINCFQMSKIGRIALDGHDGFPGFYLVTIMESTNLDGFGIVGAAFDESDGFIDTAENGIISLENLESNPVGAVFLAKNFLLTHEVNVGVVAVHHFVYGEVKAHGVKSFCGH